MKVIKSLIKNVCKIPLINILANRLINRYTSSGIIIVLMQLEHLGILPECTTKAVEGLGSKHLLIYIGIAIGIYLIIHKPQIKSKLEKRKEELELTKIEIELERAKKELKKRSKKCK